MKCVENFALSYTFPTCMKSEFLSSVIHDNSLVHGATSIADTYFGPGEIIPALE